MSGDRPDAGAEAPAPNPAEPARTPAGLGAPQPGPEVNGGELLRRKVTIRNPQGFHLRPLTAFVQAALRFQSAVHVCKQDQRVNGKSALELMLLAAEQGTELVLEVSGRDAPQALEVLGEILAAESMPDPPEAAAP